MEIITRIVSATTGDCGREEKVLVRTFNLYEQLTKPHSESFLAKVSRRKMCTLILLLDYQERIDAAFSQRFRGIPQIEQNNAYGSNHSSDSAPK